MSELEIRLAAFAWLRDHGAANGDVFPGALLNHGFEYQRDSPESCLDPAVMTITLASW